MSAAPDKPSSDPMTKVAKRVKSLAGTEQRAWRFNKVITRVRHHHEPLHQLATMITHGCKKNHNYIRTYTQHTWAGWSSRHFHYQCSLPCYCQGTTTAVDVAVVAATGMF